MSEPRVGGVLLAGGQARRMGGGDKCLLELAGRPMLAHAIERLRPQVSVLALNANGESGRFAGFGLPVMADVVEGFAGPLAGVLTGMDWLRRADPGAGWLVTAATDTPFFPADLVARLVDAAASAGAEVAFAASGGRTHPVFGLWRVSLATALLRALTEEDERKIDRFAGRYRVAEAVFEDRPFDPFFNVNRPDDLAEAARLSKLVDQAAQP
jgi:molybdopterin-guanine dinucleotide biosynthesis protein A